MAGRKWTIETHPERTKIVKAIMKGDESLRAIAGRFGISKSIVSRYLEERLSDKVAAARAEQDLEAGRAAIEQLYDVMKRMRKMYDACDEWLTDPENPQKYNLNPRGTEVLITYRMLDPQTKKPVERKATLQQLLDDIEKKSGREPIGVRMSGRDPRDLILETSKVLTKQLELMAKIEGAVHDTVVNVTIDQKFLALKAIIIKATERAPEVRVKIVEALEKLEVDG